MHQITKQTTQNDRQDKSIKTATELLVRCYFTPPDHEVGSLPCLILQIHIQAARPGSGLTAVPNLTMP